MHYVYKANEGIKYYPNNTRKFVAAAIASATVVVALAIPTLAAKPANPGCFGTDRAANIHDVFQADTSAPGASEWGAIAGERAGTNGDDNRAYKTLCLGDPA